MPADGRLEVILTCDTAQALAIRLVGRIGPMRGSAAGAFLAAQCEAVAKIAMTGADLPLIRRFISVDRTLQLVGDVGQADLVGQSETITFNVQSVGMSPGAGFEIPLIVATLIIIGLILYLFKKRK